MFLNIVPPMISKASLARSQENAAVQEQHRLDKEMSVGDARAFQRCERLVWKATATW